MHEPVLLKEVIEYLEPKPGDVVVDGTAGGGGHMRSIVPCVMPGGKVIGIEWDEEIFRALKDEVGGWENGKNIILVNDNYKNIAMILRSLAINSVDKIILDLGFSSFHIDQSGRGFSFGKNEPLLMTYSKNERPIREWLDKLSEKKLGEIIRRFGGERYAERVARAIKKSLPILTSDRLSEVVADSLPRGYERGRIHPATRTFQALRIFGNREMENLEEFLKALPEILKSGGRVAIVTFHSLEDRIVKTVFKKLASAENSFRVLTRKPVLPSDLEIKRNPRARSAKLRVLSKI